MTTAKLRSFALVAGAFIAMIGVSSAQFFSHDSEFGLVAFNAPSQLHSFGFCARYGVVSEGCPVGAVCVPKAAYYGIWAGPGTCFWGP
uniref:Putative secreted protein n=1 Tax=Amblyomma triste TaxID=251400 RepID=A0A023G978_AMBTT